MYSISFWGRARVLGTSMKEERGLMPGGDEDLVEFGDWEVLCVVC